MLGFPINGVRAVRWEAEVVKAAKVSVSRKEKTVSPSVVGLLNVWQPGVAYSSFKNVIVALID
jgi:hypothetical protein